MKKGLFVALAATLLLAGGVLASTALGDGFGGTGCGGGVPCTTTTTTTSTTGCFYGGEPCVPTTTTTTTTTPPCIVGGVPCAIPSCGVGGVRCSPLSPLRRWRGWGNLDLGGRWAKGPERALPRTG